MSLHKPPPIAAISFRGAHSSAHVSRTPIRFYSTTAPWTPTVKGGIFPPRGGIFRVGRCPPAEMQFRSI